MKIHSKKLNLNYDGNTDWFLSLPNRHSSHNREFHNVNCRFCGAIHSVNWACISVLSQVIHSVNERKTVQTNMISFVSHGAGILKISWSLCFTKFLLRSPAECPANRNLIFRLYRFSFHKPIKSRLARGRLYLPFIPYNRTTESATLRQLNSGFRMEVPLNHPCLRWFLP